MLYMIDDLLMPMSMSVCRFIKLCRASLADPPPLMRWLRWYRANKSVLIYIFIRSRSHNTEYYRGKLTSGEYKYIYTCVYRTL